MRAASRARLPVSRTGWRDTEMRPTSSRFWGASALASALLVVPASRALANSQDDDSVFTVTDDDEDDAAFAKQVKETEAALNDFLMVDEDKKVHVRKEFADGLPLPAPQVERMLQMWMKVG